MQSPPSQNQNNNALNILNMAMNGNQPSNTGGWGQPQVNPQNQPMWGQPQYPPPPQNNSGWGQPPSNNWQQNKGNNWGPGW